MSKDIVTYTAIFDGYDTLKPAMFPSICFTEGRIAPTEGWEYRTIFTGKDPTWANRNCKLLVHEHLDAEYSIYHDGNIQMLVDPHTLIEKYLKETDVAVFAHPERDCVYDEAEACIRYEKAAADIVHSQMEHYRKEGYPAKNGLAACWVLLRRHTETIKHFDEAWWTEWENGAPRDQLSFNYICRKLGMKYNVIPGNLFEGTSEEFERSPHRKDTREVIDWRTAYGQVLLMEEREYLREIAEQIQKAFDRPTIVNIGVFRCASMYCLRAGSPKAKLIGVDIKPVTVGVDASLEAEFIVADSAKCHVQVKPPVHLLFIDGDHHYPAVKADLEGWTPKIPVGGIVVMHDYAPQPKHLALLPELEGVRRATVEWAEKSKWEKLEAPGSLAAFRRSG